MPDLDHRGSRGATSAEFLGVVVVIAALVGAVLATGLGTTVSSGLASAICRISGGSSCGATASTGGTPAQNASAKGAGGPGGGSPVNGQEAPVVAGDTTDRRGAAGEARGSRREDATGRRPDQPGPTGKATTPGDAKALGVGDGVPGTSVPTPDPPSWASPDAGAGQWNSQSPGATDRATKFAAEAAANALAGTWPHASRNLLHFLGNTGAPLQQDVNQILTDVPALAADVRTRQENIAKIAVQKAKDSGATGPVTFPVSTAWQGFYITPEMSKDWFYAMGGIQYSQVGQVTVYPPTTPGGPWRYVATTKTVLRDQYNWDGGKSTQIGPFTVTDEQLAQLHRTGLAREFTMTGDSKPVTTQGAIP